MLFFVRELVKVKKISFVNSQKRCGLWFAKRRNIARWIRGSWVRENEKYCSRIGESGLLGGGGLSYGHTVRNWELRSGRSSTQCYPYTMAALGHEVNLLWPFSNMTSYYGLSRTWPPFTMAVLVHDVMYENGHSDGQKFFFFFFWKKSFGRPRPP